MKRSSWVLAVLVLATACSSVGSDATSTTAQSSTGPFPVTVEAENGTVIIAERPEAIVSLSSTATEMLFALGADDQVVAVDEQSNYPAEAPTTDLSGLTPNVEAILAYSPDLVVVGYDPGELVASLEAGGVNVISFSAAATIEDVYSQIEALGDATGHPEEASVVSGAIESELAEIVSNAPDGNGVTYFHELDNALFTATSSTFFGQIYALFGLENIADAADEDGSAAGYPQLSAEYVVAADPDIIFLTDTLYGESTDTVAARPGWDVLTAVREGDVVELDSDISSRWGPRVVDFAQAVSEAITEHVGQG